MVVQETLSADLWTGGAYGPEAGLIGMTSRFVVIALLLTYLHWRSQRQGTIRSLDFPIKIYDNPSRREQEALPVSGGGRANVPPFRLTYRPPGR